MIQAAGPSISIQGHVYYDNIQEKPDHLILNLLGQTIEPTVYDDGSYILTCMINEPNVMGVFEITFDNQTIEDIIHIQENQYSYEKDLYFFIYEEPEQNQNEEDNEKQDDPQSTEIKENEPPIADADGPYFGHIGESITFHSDNSVDPDGSIHRYYWDLGDGFFIIEESFKHIFRGKGNFSVKLKVIDNDGATDTDETYVIISAVPNIPPSNMSIDGPVIAKQGIDCFYMFSVEDPDDDMIKYVIDWGDSTSTNEEFVSSKTPFNCSHEFERSGILTISAYATDNKTLSETCSFEVMVNCVYVFDIGVLIDNDGDNIYDVFMSNLTSIKSAVILSSDGEYLIDINEDSSYDYIYNAEIHSLHDYVKESDGGFTFFSLLSDLFAIIIILFFGIILIGYISFKKYFIKQKPQVYYYAEKNEKIPINFKVNTLVNQGRDFEVMCNHIDELLEKNFEKKR